MRPIENSDIWSAYRGLSMARKAEEELRALIEEHSKLDYFASKVIAEAARQALVMRCFKP